jgi:MFS family permease
MPAMCMDLFGARAVSAIIGTLYTGAAAGNLLGPWVAGAVFDRTGSYTPVIWGCLALAALATAAAWRLKGDPPPPAPLNAAAAPVTPLRA